MRLYFFLFFLFLLSHYNLNAQRTVQGIVIDTIGTSVPYVNVILKKGTKIISYTTTSDSGYFKIEFDDLENLDLAISGLGYTTFLTSIGIEAVTSKNIDLGIITLSSSVISLSEVQLSANKPIIVKSDTISIKVDSFLDGSEEVVEDILKKLPGIEVSKDGTVTVQGKSVEKVMVEGDDLFEKGYKLLTKNLNAGLIDKVEILEHYSENARLKNIENSDKIALNLTLKDDRKTTLFGNITGSYGTDNFYEEKTNIISFNKKTKYYFFGNLNNVGSDAIGDIYQIIYPDIVTSTTHVGDGTTGINLLNLYTNPPNLDESKYNINNAELASINGIYNPNKNTKIKALLFFTADERKYTSNSTEQFNLPPVTFINNEKYGLSKNSYALSSKIDGIFNIGPNSQIEYVGRYSTGNFDENSSLIFNQDSIRETLNTASEFTDHRLTYTNRVSEYSALQITGRYIYDFKPQDYEVNSFAFENLFPENENISQIKQKSSNKLSFSALEGLFLVNRKKSNVSLKLGYSNEQNFLKSQISLINSENQNFPTAEGFNNEFNYDVANFYLKTKYIYSLENISFRPSLDFNQLFVNSNGKYTNPFVVIPSLGVNWEINKKNNFLLSYKYSAKNIPLNSIYSNFALRGYRTLRRGISEFQLLRGDFFLANYTLGNWSDSFFVNASILYNLDHKYVSSSALIEPSFVQSSSIILDDKEFYTANLSVDNFFETLSSNLKFKLGVSKNEVENIVNQSELRNIKTLTLNYGAEYKSVFTGPINFHLGTNWDKTTVETSNKSENLNNSSFLDVNININKGLALKLKNESYYFGSIKTNNTFWFTDLKVFYTIKPNKLKLTFHANNIFNSDSFSYFSIGDTGSFNREFELIPRYFLLKCEYRF